MYRIYSIICSKFRAGGYNEQQNYPVCVLGDIKINGVHYHSHTELINAWEKRKQRINWDHIFLITTDEYVRTDEQLAEFAALPYPKVLYTAKDDCKYDFQVYVPGFDKEPCVGDILRYDGAFGVRKFEKYFDCVKWLNKNK